MELLHDGVLTKPLSNVVYPLLASSEPSAIPSAPSVAWTISRSTSPPGYLRVAESSDAATGTPLRSRLNWPYKLAIGEGSRYPDGAPARGRVADNPALLDLDRVLNPHTDDRVRDYASSRGAGGFGTSSGPTRRGARRRAGRQTTRHSHDARVARRLGCVGRHARRIALGRGSAAHRRQSPADPHLLAASRPGGRLCLDGGSGLDPRRERR